MITAKKFIENYIEENNDDSNIDIEEALIEFARLHVEAALKAASDKALVLDMQENDSYLTELPSIVKYFERL